MSTARFDSLIAKGTAHTPQSIRLADGHTLSLDIAVGAEAATMVCLWPGLETPAADGWENEDPAETFVTGADMDGGREFCDVPVQALRDLIDQHGGEAEAAANDKVIAAALAQLRAAGVRCTPDGDQGGYYVRVPLADGSTITFAGTSTDPDDSYPDVSTGHPVRNHGGWSAQWSDGGNFAEVYDSHGQSLPYEEDTTALVADILKRARLSGGSAPEEGAGENAEQLARKALTGQGITAHLDDEPGNAWLVIGSDQKANGFPDQENKPYILLSVYNDTDGEWTLDRPPARPGDEWQVMTGDGNGTESTLMTRRADRLDDCAEAIANWLTSSGRDSDSRSEFADAPEACSEPQG